MCGARPYVLPKFAEKYAGSVLCLATTAEPDTSAFDAPEIVKRMKKHHHAGLIVCSDERGAGEGTGRPVQHRVRAAVSGGVAAAGQAHCLSVDCRVVGEGRPIPEEQP